MADLNPQFGPPNRVGAFPGWSDLDRSRLLVATLFDPAANPVSVTCNGVTYTSGVDFTLTSRVTDSAKWTTNTSVDGLWTGRLEITGLEPFTRYPFTVVQGSRVNDGTTMTAPRKTDKYRIGFGSCQRNQGQVTEWRIEGWWDSLYAEYHDTSKPPITGVWWVDDYLYAGTIIIDDKVYEAFPETATCTGLSYTGRPDTTLDPDSYLMVWCAAFGMLGPDEIGDWFMGYQSEWVGQLLGRGLKRGWCQRHVNAYVNGGDHDMAGANDVGWTHPSQQLVDNARFLANGNTGPGKAAWDSFIGQFQPPLVREVLDAPLDTVTDAWVCQHGAASLITFDGVTRGDGEVPPVDWLSNDPQEVDGEGNPYPVNSILGVNQIADVLTLVHQYKSPINLWGMMYALRYPVSSYANLQGPISGAQHPLYDHCPAEFDRLITATGQNPPSIMDGKYTNGANGVSILLHGDQHMAYVYEYSAPIRAGNRQEIIYGICTGTWDGSPNFGINDPNSFTAVGQTIAGMTLKWAPEGHLGSNYGVGFAGDGSDRRNFWGVILEIDGSASPPSVTVSLRDHDNIVQWDGTWHQYGGNLPSDRAPAFPGSPSVDVE